MGIDLNKAKRVQNLEDASTRTERIRQALQADIRNVIKYLFPKATFNASDARIGDVSGTRGSSLSIALRPLDKAGMWIDHASNGEVGDILTLWQAAQNIATFADTLNEADAWLNGTVTPRGNMQRRKTDKLKSEPDQKVKKVQTHEHIYTDIHGNKVCAVFRYDLFDADSGERIIGKDGKPDKSFSIYSYATKKWEAPNPRPIYRASDVYQFTDVVVVEGEKCADALASIGVEATTASGGSNTKLENTDWTPLAGKRVFLWPDNDSTGKEYMERLGEHLAKVGCDVVHVPIPAEAPAKWDAADAVAENFDVFGLLRSLIDGPSSDEYLSRVYWDDINYEYEGEILEDLLPRRGLATLFGPSTGGKTFIVLDLMYRIGRGEDIFDKESEECGIAYCAFEGFDGVRKRITGIKQHRKVSGIEFELIDSPWLLHNQRDWKDFVATIEGVKADMEARGKRLGIVVIDTLTSATAGSDTNSQADVTAAMKKLKRLAIDLDLLILNVGHSGKETGRGMVGSFAYKSEADAFLECEIETDEETGMIKRRSLFVDKSKDGRDNYVISDYDLQIVSIGKKPNGKDITTCLVRWKPPPIDEPKKTESGRMMEYMMRVRMILKTGEKLGSELEKELSLSRTRVSEILAVMQHNGAVFSKTVGSRKIWYLSKGVENEKPEDNQGTD